MWYYNTYVIKQHKCPILYYGVIFIIAWLFEKVNINLEEHFNIGRIKMSTKYVFVTGGVVSALGKGITAASLGRLLKNRG